MSYLLSVNHVQTYTEQLDRLAVKLRSFPDDERAAKAAALLDEAKQVLTPEPAATDDSEPQTVEQPTDEDGNPLPPPSPMEFPQP